MQTRATHDRSLRHDRPVRVLTSQELNRALLARQRLLERSAEPLPRVLEAVAGIQAQYAPSMYVGLWSRTAGLARGAVTGALEDRSAVQAWMMRVTIHLVSREDFWPIALAVRDARRTWWLRAYPEPGSRAMAASARKLRAALSGGGALRRTEVEALLGKDRARGVGLWVDLVRVPPSGTWERRRADLFGLAEDWIGPPPEGMTARTGAAHLVTRYLAGFGPASRKDVAGFTGLPPAALKAVLAGLELRTFASGAGEELLDLPDGPLPDPATPAPPRLLPTWDATLLAHARRTGLLPEEHRPRVFNTRLPQSVPTFTVGGVVAGIWRHEDGAVRLEPFGRLDRADERAVREEADRLAQFYA
jgi:hypothetical protein